MLAQASEIPSGGGAASAAPPVPRPHRSVGKGGRAASPAPPAQPGAGEEEERQGQQPGRGRGAGRAPPAPLGMQVPRSGRWLGGTPRAHLGPVSSWLCHGVTPTPQAQPRSELRTQHLASNAASPACPGTSVPTQRDRRCEASPKWAQNPKSPLGQQEHSSLSPRRAAPPGTNASFSPYLSCFSQIQDLKGMNAGTPIPKRAKGSSEAPSCPLHTRQHCHPSWSFPQQHHQHQATSTHLPGSFQVNNQATRTRGGRACPITATGQTSSPGRQRGGL